MVIIIIITMLLNYVTKLHQPSYTSGRFCCLVNETAILLIKMAGTHMASLHFPLATITAATL